MLNRSSDRTLCYAHAAGRAPESAAPGRPASRRRIHSRAPANRLEEVDLRLEVRVQVVRVRRHPSQASLEHLQGELVVLDVLGVIVLGLLGRGGLAGTPVHGLAHEGEEGVVGDVVPRLRERLVAPHLVVALEHGPSLLVVVAADEARLRAHRLAQVVQRRDDGRARSLVDVDEGELRARAHDHLRLTGGQVGIATQLQPVLRRARPTRGSLAALQDLGPVAHRSELRRMLLSGSSLVRRHIHVGHVDRQQVLTLLRGGGGRV
eukprot:scaffold24943_cov61-Phaeocystis_antarctica.AAC.4